MYLRNPFGMFVAFLNVDGRCPVCGTIGEKKVEKDAGERIDYFRCPMCETEFTEEMILSFGEAKLEGHFKNT